MCSDIKYDACYSYPGEYVPLLTDEQINEELCRCHEGKMLVPPVNLVELPDAFKVEIAMPGLRREDFLVHIDGNVLYVRVLHKETATKDLQNFKLHEFNYVCFEKSIHLPPDADPGFMSAEYKAGMLQVVVPKTQHAVKSPYVQVVVY